MLINEQHIMLEARIQMRFEAQLDDDGIVVAVDVRVDAVQALEHVAYESGERLGERHADARGEHGFVVDVGLHPGHEVLDVLGCGHLGGLLVGLGVLPEVFESAEYFSTYIAKMKGCMYVLTRRWLSSRGSSGASRTL